MHSTPEAKIAAFKAWLVEHGGYLHPDVHFKPGAHRFSPARPAIAHGGGTRLIADMIAARFGV